MSLEKWKSMAVFRRFLLNFAECCSRVAMCSQCKHQNPNLFAEFEDMENRQSVITTDAIHF